MTASTGTLRTGMINFSRNVVEVLVISWLGFTFCACSDAQMKQNTATSEDVTVCDLLANVSRYRGQVVTLRGVYWNGLRDHCSQPLVTGDHVWPSAVNLVDSEYPSFASDVAHFKTDVRSWDELDAIVLREAKARRREAIWVSVTGLVRAPASYVREDGKVVAGYGHLGTLPVELVVKQIRDVLIKPTPTYDYGALVPRNDRRGQ
jgi:hypothetical protein